MMAVLWLWFTDQLAYGGLILSASNCAFSVYVFFFLCFQWYKSKRACLSNEPTGSNLYFVHRAPLPI